MSRFIKRLSDGKIFRIRCSEIPTGKDGDFNIIWEIFEGKWKIIDTPKHSEYSFAVDKQHFPMSFQLSIDAFL